MRSLRLVACLVVLGLATVACSESEPPEAQGKASAEPPEGEPAPEGIDGVVAVRVGSANHVEGTVDYDTYPPVGGDHFPRWHDCGFWTEPVPDELAVHALEHGAVWIAYQPDLSEEEQGVLEAAAEGNDHVLVTPYPELRAPLVLTAWGRQLDLDSVDDDRFVAFINTYVDTVAPEAGAPCSGGVSPR